MPTIFDQSAISPSIASNISESVVANDFTLGTSFTLQGASLFLSDRVSNNNGALDNFSGTLGWAIYADNGSGTPGTLLFSGQDAAPVVTDTGLNGFNSDIMQAEVSFGITIQLDAGTYWLAVHEGNWGSAFDGSAIHWIASSTIVGPSRANESDEANPVNWVSGLGDNAFSLEGVATNIVVDNAADEDDGDYSAGNLSLREAVALANSSDDATTITFAASVAGQGIVLFDQLVLVHDVTIDGDVNGDNVADIVISGNGSSRIFTFFSEADNVNLLSLTLSDGDPNDGLLSPGGAIWAQDVDNLTISDTSIVDNWSDRGGGIYLNNSALTMTNSLVARNTAWGDGGGIFAAGGSTVDISSSTIHDNFSLSFGGGIGVDSSTLNLLNTTVTGNSANTGGGIDSFLSTANVINSVVAENTSSISNSDVAGVVSSASHSAFGSDVAGVTGGQNGNLENVTSGQLLLGQLANNGGTVQTRNITDTSSVLFNAGSNGAAGLPATDGNGNDRIGDGTVDIGATEFSEPLVVTTASDAVDDNDGLLSLREAVALANLGDDADTIVFSSALAGQTITLTQGELTLTQDVTIDGDITGDSMADITLSGGNATGILMVSGIGTDLTVRSLTLTNGAATYGGAIYGGGTNSTLQVIHSTISNSSGSSFGGGIFTFGNTYVTNSTLFGNSAGDGGGGGIYSRYGNVVLTNTTVYDNNTTGLGGGVKSGLGSLAIINSTIAGNQADSDGAQVDAGGGIAVVNNTLSIINSVVAGNTSGSSNTANDVKGTVTGTNSVFGTDVGGVTGGVGGNLENVTAGQLKLGQLLDNGGSVLTFAPLDGSILISKGKAFLLPKDIHDLDNDGNVTERLPVDATGEVRIQNNRLDIGAVEYTRDETIRGTAAADVIIGGRGRDVIVGKGGADTLDGGKAFDVADYSGSTLGVTVSLRVGVAGVGGDAQGDRLTGIEHLTGSQSGDTLTGNAIINLLIGNGGADTLSGLGGIDTMEGGAGNDRLIGGGGVDRLTGGEDADTFVLDRLTVNRDVIFDYETGIDRIEIDASDFGAGLVAGIALSADQFISNATGTAKDAEDRFVYSTNNGLLYFDADGSGTGERVLVASFRSPFPTLSEADFILV